MPQWSDGYIHSNGIRIHYYRTGGNKPAVVFNHGAGDDGLCWTRIAKELENDFDVIMPDGRGHGKSGSGKGDYSTAARVADLACLIQELKLEAPIVGGHSLGADTSMNLAAAYPQMARAIFLEDPPIIQPGEVFGDGKQALKAEDMGKMMARFMWMFKLLPRFIALPMARKASPTYPDDEILPWLDAKERVSANFLNSLGSLALEISSPFEVFRKITVPTLLFIGDKASGSIVSEETAAKAARENNCIRVVHLKGASHDIRRTRFDGYMPSLKEFLQDNR